MHNLNSKGWNSQAHREFHRRFESSNLSRDNPRPRDPEPGQGSNNNNNHHHHHHHNKHTNNTNDDDNTTTTNNNTTTTNNNNKGLQGTTSVWQQICFPLALCTGRGMLHSKSPQGMYGQFS